MKSVAAHNGNSPCIACERLPRPIPQEGSLFFAAPLEHTRSKLAETLRALGALRPGSPPGIVEGSLRSGLLARLAPALEAGLSPRELEDTRVLPVADAAGVGIADLPRMQPLSHLLGSVRGEWLASILEENRLYTEFQPIIDVRSGRTFAYEALVRARDTDGSSIEPSKLFDAARDANLLFHLDRDARISAIRTAARQGLSTGLFINFNPTSIYDPAYCLQSTMTALRQARLPAHKVVFEVVESDAVSDPSHLLRILDFYRDRGYGVALDDLGAGFNSLNLLEQVRPDYVKLDAHLVRDVDSNPYKAHILDGLLQMARSLGVTTVVEGVETRAEWAWVRDHKATLVQGFYFARPGAIDATVSAAA
jgi:EAL domain-containing protein (putative c-di-GMP-specific phosphodiesterase class I)